MRPVFGALVLLLLAPLTARADSILVNGNFELGPPMNGFQDVDVFAGSSAIPGWTVLGQSIDYLGPPWDVADGSHAVDLDGRDSVYSGVSQTFATTPGGMYDVSFDLSGNPQGGPTIKQLLVLVDSFSQSYSFDTSGQTTTALTWTPIGFSFIATGSTATLSFVSLTGVPNSYGALLDNVAATRVPEPSTLVLLLAGVAGAVGILRRARTAQ